MTVSRRGMRPRDRAFAMATMSRFEGRDRGGRDDRGFFERAGDEVASWFGDDDAERRRREDQMREGRERGQEPAIATTSIAAMTEARIASAAFAIAAGNGRAAADAPRASATITPIGARNSRGRIGAIPTAAIAR